MKQNNLNDDFPSLPPNSASQTTTTNQTQPNNNLNNSSIDLSSSSNSPLSIQSYDQFLKKDISNHDFGQAVSALIENDFFPETLYDIPEIPNTKTNNTRSYPRIPNLKLLTPEFFKNYDLQPLFYYFIFMLAHQLSILQLKN